MIHSEFTIGIHESFNKQAVLKAKHHCTNLTINSLVIKLQNVRC